MTTRAFPMFLLSLVLTAGTAAAQLAPYNEAGLTMGHWHLATKDVEAEKKLFLAMGGKLYKPGGQPLIAFPGVYISLILNGETGEGGTVGSVVNHVGFIVDNVQKRVAEWKAAGVKVLPGGALPGGGNRLDQAFVETPDGVRMEILEDKTQTVPIRNEHVHLVAAGRGDPESCRLVCDASSGDRQPRATTRRWSTSLASKCASTWPTRRRRRRATACSITSAST